MHKPWMVYGANGYTGELIAREAARRGLKPILAGRSPGKLRHSPTRSAWKHASSILAMLPRRPRRWRA